MSRDDDLACQVGDSVRHATECSRLPVGTVVAFAHPIYQGTIAAVRVEIANGDRLWSVTGQGTLQKTLDIKRATGWAPFVILRLPDSDPLNTDVQVGYRTFGPATAADGR